MSFLMTSITNQMRLHVHTPIHRKPAFSMLGHEKEKAQFPSLTEPMDFSRPDVRHRAR